MLSLCLYDVTCAWIHFFSAVKDFLIRFFLIAKGYYIIGFNTHAIKKLYKKDTSLYKHHTLSLKSWTQRYLASMNSLWTPNNIIKLVCNYTAVLPFKNTLLGFFFVNVTAGKHVRVWTGSHSAVLHRSRPLLSAHPASVASLTHEAAHNVPHIFHHFGVGSDLLKVPPNNSCKILLFWSAKKKTNKQTHCAFVSVGKECIRALCCCFCFVLPYRLHLMWLQCQIQKENVFSLHAPATRATGKSM